MLIVVMISAETSVTEEPREGKLHARLWSALHNRTYVE